MPGGNEAMTTATPLPLSAGGLRVAVALLLFLAGTAAQAMDGDTFRPEAAYTIGSDSNLFRSNSSLATPVEKVTYQTMGIGFALDWKQGRQRVTAEAQAKRNQYNSRYSSLLNNTGHNAQLDWQWTLGKHWDGHLGGSLDQSLGSYADKQSPTVSSNIVNSNRLNFETNYHFHPRWQATLRSESTSIRHSADGDRGSNVRGQSKTLGVYYLGRTLERLGVEYRLGDTHYPDRNPLADNMADSNKGKGVATSYQEHRFGLVARWVADGKVQLNGRVGQVSVNNTIPVAGNGGTDYSAAEYRLDGNWALSGKSALGGALYREIWNSTYDTANHAVNDGASLNYTWQFQPKTSLQGALARKSVGYDPTLRVDKVSTQTLAVAYLPWTGGELSAGLQHETRASSLQIYNYGNDTLFFNANLKF